MVNFDRFVVEPPGCFDMVEVASMLATMVMACAVKRLERGKYQDLDLERRQRAKKARKAGKSLRVIAVEQRIR